MMSEQVHYDPLVDSHPGTDCPYPDSYWADTIAPSGNRPLTDSNSARVAIIGAGYTGLSCAHQLASRWGMDPVVLEANQVGWGCSGRNAGFVLNGTGRLSLQHYHQRWGEDTAKAVYTEFRTGVERVRELAEQANDHCDLQADGYLKLAHTPQSAQNMAQHTDFLRQQFNDTSQWLTQVEARKYIRSSGVFAANFTPYCFGLNPLKFVRHLADQAEKVGARVYTGSPVLHCHKTEQGYRLITPQGEVNAEKVVIATNGYTLNHFHPALDGRHFPVQSSILVTEPLSEHQRQACGLTHHGVFMDTRTLKYYYRLLPDNRLLFGGRGAITGREADKPRYRRHLEKALKQWFPSLESVRSEYFWSGWVSVALDDYPRIGQIAPSLYTSMGYCGAGLSFATLSGERLADIVAQGREAQPSLPFYQSSLPRFPLPRLRRLGLKAFYQWAQWRDN